jgi:hypothetical protein
MPSNPSSPNSEHFNPLESISGGQTLPQTEATSPQEPGVEIPIKGAENYDPWDLDAARNRQKKDRRVKVVTAYRIATKPREGAFFRINNDPAYQIDALLYIEKGESGIAEGVYFVDWTFSDEIGASGLAVLFLSGFSISSDRIARKETLHPLR